MTSTLRRAGLTAAAGLLSVSLVACGGDSGEEPSSEDTGAASESPSEEESEESSEAPSGDTVSGAGVSFTQPEGWTAINPAEMQKQSKGSPELKEMADKMGIPPEQLSASMGQAELVLLDPQSAKQGFANNINVVAPGGAMPPPEEIEQQFTQLGATVNDVTTEESEIGEVTRVAYVLEAAQTKVSGTSLALDRDGELVTITISTTDEATTTQVADDIIASLGEA